MSDYTFYFVALCIGTGLALVLAIAWIIDSASNQESRPE